MGRKGDSKRKTPKSKNSPVSTGNASGVVSNLANASTVAVVKSSGKDGINVSGKGGKKK
jgi:hypothetical protein